SAAKRTAIAAPIPRLAPVINARVLGCSVMSFPTNQTHENRVLIQAKTTARLEYPRCNQTRCSLDVPRTACDLLLHRCNARSMEASLADDRVRRCAAAHVRPRALHASAIHRARLRGRRLGWCRPYSSEERPFAHRRGCILAQTATVLE